MRLIDDSRAVGASLASLADEAAERFPPETVWEEAVDQPTEAFDVAEMLAAEHEADPGEEDERPLPDGLDELEPPPEFGP